MTDTTELLSLFSYNPLSGKFYDKNNQEIGTKHRYLIISLKGKPYYAQVLAYLHQNKKFPKNSLTFKDGNTFNLKYSNIEEASKRTIARRSKLKSTNTSGICGITYCKQTLKWKVMIYNGFRNVYRGRYKIFEEAVLARYEAEIEFGFLKDNPNTSAAKYVKESIPFAI